MFSALDVIAPFVLGCVCLNWFGHAVITKFALCARKRMDDVTAGKGDSDDDIREADVTAVVDV